MWRCHTDSQVWSVRVAAHTSVMWQSNIALLFFFQAEDGIRAGHVTGVQTCALPIFAEASVPRITLVLRKTYGGAYIAMNSRALGATKVFAWPGAEIAVMGPVAAIRILHRRTLADVPPDKLHEVEADLAAEHQREAGGLERAQALGVVDEIIEPSRTREAIVRAIADAPQRRGAHGNIPL